MCTAPLAELVTRLCGHPAYRLLTLRSVPQLPPANIDFTTFTWPALTKRLRQMLVTGGQGRGGCVLGAWRVRTYCGCMSAGFAWPCGA